MDNALLSDTSSLLQVPLGSTFKDPGCFAQATALGKSSPVTVTATLPGTAPFTC